MAKNRLIIKKPKRLDLNVGFIIIAVVVLYIIVSVILYMTSTKTIVYEVHAGSLALDNIYTAFIVRDEEIVSSEYAGTFNHYINAGERTNYSTTVYSVDEAGRVSEKIDEIYKSELTKEDLNEVSSLLGNFSLNYKDSHFSDIYRLHHQITNSLSEIHSAVILDDIQNIVTQSGSENLFHMVKTKDTGMIMFTFDAYSTFDESQLSADLFDTTKYKSSAMMNNDLINIGDPAYRLIHNDEWSLYVKLSETDANALANDKTMGIRFIDADIECNAEFSVLRQGDQYYGKLSLKKYMINFADERYVKIEMMQRCKSGLKIPTSAVFAKSFYTIPKKYMTEGGSFVRPYYSEKGEQMFDVINTTIYDEDENYYYVSMKDFESGELLVREGNPDDQFMIGTIGERYGAYCVNKGYAIFKIVNILDSNDEYHIVERGTNYGLAVYDHIVLDHRSLKENEIID